MFIANECYSSSYIPLGPKFSRLFLCIFNITRNPFITIVEYIQNLFSVNMLNIITSKLTALKENRGE